MGKCTPIHLTADDFDAWLEGTLTPDQASHLETCLTCQEAARLERELADQLSLLPQFAPPSRLADRVMAAMGAAHLTADDFDAWLAGALSAPKRAHLAGCTECLAFAEAERAIAARLEAMPLFDPTPEFGARVMARVTLPEPAWSRSITAFKSKVFESRRSLATAAGVAGLLIGSMGASVAWSLSHQETIAAMGSWLSGQAVQWFWVGLRGAVSNLVEQPWYGDLRSMLGSPARAALLSAFASTLYLGGLLAMRRLLVAPSPRMSHARI